jgi:hypothetical protein
VTTGGVFLSAVRVFAFYVVLSLSGYKWNTWQFWAIFLCLLLIGIATIVKCNLVDNPQ